MEIISPSFVSVQTCTSPFASPQWSLSQWMISCNIIEQPFFIHNEGVVLNHLPLDMYDFFLLCYEIYHRSNHGLLARLVQLITHSIRAQLMRILCCKVMKYIRWPKENTVWIGHWIYQRSRVAHSLFVRQLIQTNIGLKVWICKPFYVTLRDAITLPCLNCHYRMAEPPLQAGYGWVIASPGDFGFEYLLMP